MLSFLLCVVLLCGCGGGGSTPWGAYTPPPDVISTADLQTRAAEELLAVPQRALALTDAADYGFLGYGEIPALTNLIFEVIFRLMDDYGDLVPLQAGPAASRQTRALALLAAAAQKGPALARTKAEGDGTFFRWTDADTGIRWTGRIIETGDELTPVLRGVGPNTECTVALRFVFELGSRLTLRARISGPIAAVVYVPEGAEDVVVTDGRAVLESSLAAVVDAVAGKSATLDLQTHLAGAFEVPQGGDWRTVSKQDTTLELQGTITDGLSASFSLTGTQGELLGEGLYWARHDSKGKFAFSRDDGPNGVAITDEVSFSDGMTGQLTLTSGPGGSLHLGGYLHGANGAVLGTLSGELGGDPPATITWPDGSSTPLE